MDADYSHDSREIPELIKPTNAGGDWLSEADIAKEAALGLEHISASSEKAANLVTKVRIDMKISYHTSGMRCYSTKLVKSIINDLHSQT